MMPEFFWMGGMWIFPVIMFILIFVIIFSILRRENFKSPRCDSNQYNCVPKDLESALEILKKRYAKGELTKDEFVQMKKDIL